MILITGRCNWNHDNSRTSRYCSISSCSSTDVMTKTVGVDKEDSNTTITTNNNISNTVLGSLFLTGEDRLTTSNQSIKPTLRYHMQVIEQ